MSLPLLKTTKGKILTNAVINKHPITFMYIGPRKEVLSGKRIYAEPVAIGISKKGNLLVRCYITPPTKSKSGYKRSFWRTYMLSRMTNIITQKSKKFELNRPLYNGGGDDKTFIQTLFSNE